MMIHLSFLLLLTATTSKAQTIIDLSQPWTNEALYNQNKASCTINAAMNPRFTRGYVIARGGQIVSEGYTSGNNVNGKYDAWSATKSWSTFFMGVLVDQGKLSVTERLADIFTADADWVGVSDAANKKTVLVSELLTMTSGLVPAACQSGLNQGQSTLQEVLNHVDYDGNQRGQFCYIGGTHILARIIERRSGQTPRQFASSSGIFSKLGMTDSDFEWTTFGGVEGSAYGLKTNPRIMAKLGQLFLQNGLAKTGDHLVSASWVTASTQNYVNNDIANAKDVLPGYGYQWYVGGTGAYTGAAAALGGEGQIILYLPASDITIAIMGSGACNGAPNNVEFLGTIIANLGDLSVAQTSCDQSFSYWKHFVEHPGLVLLGPVRGVSNYLRGTGQFV